MLVFVAPARCIAVRSTAPELPIDLEPRTDQLSWRGNVLVQPRVVRESADLVGTPFSLVHQADKTLGYGAAFNLEVPLLGEVVFDGLLAVDAELDGPRGVALAGDGSLYIADQEDWRVRRAFPNGQITTVAGGGTTRESRFEFAPLTGLISDSERGAGDRTDYAFDPLGQVLTVTDSTGLVETFASGTAADAQRVNVTTGNPPRGPDACDRKTPNGEPFEGFALQDRDNQTCSGT